MSVRKSRARLIADRRKAILNEIEGHELAVSTLKAELAELDIAEKTLERLARQAGEDYTEDTEIIEKVPSYPPVRTRVPPPLSTEKLTVREMVETLMAEEEYKNGITTQEALQEIRKRWNPEIDPNHVRPLAWRMVKEGKWQKDENGRHKKVIETEGTPVSQAPLV